MPKNVVLLCQHCGNETPHDVALEHNCIDEFYDNLGKVEKVPAYYFCVICKTCNHVSLYYSCDFVINPYNIKAGRLLYPVYNDLPDSVPQAIRDTYQEAKRIKVLAPNSFAVQIRRALEYLCEDNGAPNGNLEKRINYLADQHIIPNTLAEMSHTLRFLGNIGAHADIAKVTPPDVWVIDEFFNAIVEYVYIAPEKIENLKKAIEKRKENKK